MTTRSTTEIQRQAPSALLSGLLNSSAGASREAGERLIAEARSFGLDMRSYLRLAADPRRAEGEERAQYQVGASAELLNGYEAALAFLNLPVRDDLDGGVTMQAAADTFQTFTGTRALFPEVIDDILKWRYRQTTFETTDGMLAQRRTVNGNEMLSTIVEDVAADYENPIRAIAEGGRVPVHAIRTSQQAVKFYKFGHGYKTTYEFGRRASLDILTPYAARVQTQIERSKVASATSVLINGDGAYSAAGVVTSTSFNGVAGATAVDGKLSIEHLMAWLVARAQAGTPIDTVVGNWDMYLQWILAFYLKGSDANVSEADRAARSGMSFSANPVLDMPLQFQLSSSAPAKQLVGFSKADTLEELVEAGSLINESEQAIKTQEVVYVRTENSGHKLVFGDTRQILNLAV